MRNRARARALARRREPQPWPPWLLLLLLTLAIAVMDVAHAAPADQREAMTGAPHNKNALQKQPPAAGVTKAAPGVLKPKTNPDPGMAVATPNPKEFPMPVIRPNAKSGTATVVPR